MLVITRRVREKVLIGDDIVVSILDVCGGRVRIGIEAPPEVVVNREEVSERIKQQEQGVVFTHND